jgi:hypothetical protein
MYKKTRNMYEQVCREIEEYLLFIIYYASKSSKREEKRIMISPHTDG